MRLRKCPRCELNYIKEDEKLCNVCRRDMKGEADIDELQPICAECGENHAAIGQDICAFCLREKKRREKLDKLMERSPAETISEIDVDELDEIDMPTNGDDIPSDELQVIDRELGRDEDDEIAEDEESEL